MVNFDCLLGLQSANWKRVTQSIYQHGITEKDFSFKKKRHLFSAIYFFDSKSIFPYCIDIFGHVYSYVYVVSMTKPFFKISLFGQSWSCLYKSIQFTSFARNFINVFMFHQFSPYLILFHIVRMHIFFPKFVSQVLLTFVNQLSISRCIYAVVMEFKLFSKLISHFSSYK